MAHKNWGKEMAVFKQETTIQRAPGEVFAYVSDMTKHGEWASNGLQITQTSNGPIGVSSTFSSTAQQFGTQRETQTVTEYAPGSRFAFEASGALGLARHIFELSAADSGTRVAKSMELIKPSFLARIMTLKLKADQPKAMAEDLSRIKQKLES
jgi:hypothetical protein